MTRDAVFRLALVAALAITLAACTGTPPDSSQAPASASASVALAHAYDGIWASEPLTRPDLAAVLVARGLSDARLDEWTPDWNEIDYRIFEVEISEGRWLLHENAEGLDFGTRWEGDFEVIDADTVVGTPDPSQCAVTFDMHRDGDALSIHVAADACADPDDLAIQAILYESSPFHLVQAADWAPPASSAGPSPTDPADQASNSFERQTRRPIGTVDGAPLGYLEYLPPDYGNQPSPLIVFLHGSGESGAGDELALGVLSQAGIPSLIASNRWPDARPFVVLSPQHEQVETSFCMEAQEIDAFLHFALAHYDIDPSRVYLTGLSCGAIGLWNYLAAHADELVAAAIPIAGYGIGAVQLAGCDLGRLPLWAFHGSADDRVFVRGDVYPLTVLQSCTNPAPVDARLTVYPDGSHDVWTDTYRARTYDIYAWLLSHHK
jgi:poly(3-hydroxybutyrate) depolymerase